VTFTWPELPTDETPERRAEIRRVAAALRAVIERFVATTAPLEVFHGVADDLEAVAARLGEYPQGHLFIGFAEAANAGPGDAMIDNSPLMGLSNPLAPPMDISIVGSEVAGTVTCGSAYEGPPGHVHGGFIAAMFDDLLGLAQGLSGHHGMTGRLTVHYRSPTPLHTELTLRGWLERADGRKIVCKGTMFAGDTLCAEAEGLFITVDFSKLEQMIEAREAARGPQ
jgi:acyl-coenzyme A thioesterase PaaI-like protein